MPSSDRQLKRWYNAFNKRWFRAKLPANTAIRYEAIDNRGECIESIAEGEPIVIRIHPAVAWSRRQAKMVLLHEMCHIACGFHVDHGRKFQEEMLRLASAGAFKNLW